MTTLKKKFIFINRFIDLKTGMIAAFFMASAVFFINYFSTHFIGESMIAAAKQWVYTFLLGGAVLKSCEHIVRSVRQRNKAIFLASVIPFVVTLLLVYGLHNLRGTPKPLESTMPTLIVITGTFYWAIKKRKEMEKKKMSVDNRPDFDL